MLKVHLNDKVVGRFTCTKNDWFNLRCLKSDELQFLNILIS